MAKLTDVLNRPSGEMVGGTVAHPGLSARLVRLGKTGQVAVAHHPLGVTLIGLGLIGAVGGLSLNLGKGFDFQFFYLLGCAAVGWFAGAVGALVCGLVSVGFLSAGAAARSGFSMVLIVNSLMYLVGFISISWLAARLGKEARALAKSVGEGTAVLQKEVQEHKETTELLREGVQLFRQVTDNIADVFWVTDPRKTHFEYVSPGFEAVWGTACESLMAAPNTWLEAIHREDRERVTRAIFTRQIRGEYDEEYRVVRPDGSLRWVHDRAFPVKDVGGAVYRLVGITEDITERKRAEQLMQAERDIGLVLSSTNDLGFALGRLLEIAKQLEGIDCGAVYLLDAKGELHLSAHRGLSGSFLQRIGHYPAEAIESNLARQGEVTYVGQAQIPRSLEVLWGSEGLRALAIVPIRHKGRVEGMLNLGSYSEAEILPRTRAGIEMIAAQVAGAIARIRAEDSLRRSEAHVRTIINGAPVALLAVDAQGLITLEDGQALRTMGVQPGQHVQQSAAEVYRDFPLMLQNIQRAMSGEEFSSQLEFASTVFECRFTPLAGAPGGATGFIVVATDITERCRLQRQVLEISDREQARLGQDIHDGLSQQLIGMAFSANSLEKTLTAQQRPEVAIAHKICSLLDEAIDESRRVSRGLYPIRLSTHGLLPALEELAAGVVERYGVSCVCETAGQPPACDVATSTHLYRIAQEAVNNALKHSGARHVQIRLAQSERELLLEVRDDGKGFGGSSAPGSGMGLHIMEYRARLIGGTLEVRGANPGTVVVLRLCQILVGES